MGSKFLEDSGNESSNVSVVVGRDGSDVSDLINALNGNGLLLESFDDLIDSHLDSSAEVHWVHSSSDRFAALFEDSTGENCGGRCTVTSLIVSLAGDLLNKVSTDVLIAIAELDILGHSDTILGNLGHAKSLVDDDIAATRAQSHLHSISKHFAALEHEGACLSSEFDVLTGEVHTLGSDELGGSSAVEKCTSGLDKGLLESRLHHCFLFVYGFEEKI